MFNTFYPPKIVPFMNVKNVQPERPQTKTQYGAYTLQAG
jgi:hypothetical protein